jgi:dipeptidyl-peptidase-4
MIKYNLVALLLTLSTLAFAQKKSITAENLGSFRAAETDDIKSLPDGLHYSVIGANGRTIDKIDYATGKKVAELINLDKIENCKIERIEGYDINSLETRILFYEKSESIYRYSFSANYYLYDIRYKELKPLTDKGRVRAANFSPDGENVAYVFDNNIYLAKLRFNTESAVTTNGKESGILNGIPDWVYEEEFAMDRVIEWSVDSKEIAFVRFDQSAVKEYQFSLYKTSSPALEANALYPSTYNYKYPKAGETNSKVSVQVFNILDRTTKAMDLGKETDFYIPRIKWTTQPGQLGIIKLNRRQNQLDIIIANSATTLCNAIFTQRNDYFISDDVLDNFAFLPDASGFVYMGEMNGYSHLYLFSMAGRQLSQLTKGNFDVVQYLGYDAASKLFYYQSAERSPLQRDIYVTGIDGKNKKLLSSEAGTNTAGFSTNYKYYINTHSSTKQPQTVTVCDNKGKTVRVIEDNSALKKRLAEYDIPQKELVKIPVGEGLELNAHIMKPVDFDASKKYPVLISQYSGPSRQEVLDKWNIEWEHVVASQGVVVVYVDPRGTGARGEAFRKCTYMKLGQIESDDLIASANYLGTLPYVDKDRMGIWGWSYGGYATLMCLSRGDVFKMGIAVAPVTDWRFYNSIYTERYMRRPFENEAGYNTSPMALAKNLKGKLLLVHGTADDNVHFQNTMEYVDRLVQEDKQFSMFAYPNRNHGIYGGNSRVHLYKMMLEYIKNNL